jgi:hypothetical protein
MGVRSFFPAGHAVPACPFLVLDLRSTARNGHCVVVSNERFPRRHRCVGTMLPCINHNDNRQVQASLTVSCFCMSFLTNNVVRQEGDANPHGRT